MRDDWEIVRDVLIGFYNSDESMIDSIMAENALSALDRLQAGSVEAMLEKVQGCYRLMKYAEHKWAFEISNEDEERRQFYSNDSPSAAIAAAMEQIGE